MDYPKISDETIERLTELGFAGTDANLATSLLEYAGIWS